MVEKHKEHHEHKKTKIKKSTIWQLTSAVLGILLIVSISTGGFGINKVGGLTEQQAADKAINFVNNNLVQPGTKAEFVSVEETNNMYKIMTNYQNKVIPIYTTKDGSLLFPSGAVDLDAQPQVPTTPETPELPKKDKPEVKLFVMSQCPYGTIAEKAMEPVVDLLGDKADIRLYFIANDNGDGTFRSLHGQPEVDGDMRQACIDKYYSNEVLYDYLVCVADDYRNLGTIWEKCAESNGIDAAKIKSCFEGEEGKTLLAENVKEAEKYGVTGSPTLIINDQRYSGARTSEAFKQAICSSFKEEQDECSETLSETAASAGGSC